MTDPDAMRRESRLTSWLREAPTSLFSLYAIGAAFSCYFCMYAFRKPYTVGLFEGEGLAGLDYKISLILAQLIGYTLSKFIGIKVISEMDARGRGRALLSLIGIAELSLIAFAVSPPAWGPIFLFCNGLPLGMVWGLVFASLEGRRLTELLGAGLSASYIIASGFVKSAGRAVMSGWGVSEAWMPAVTGLLFLLPFVCRITSTSIIAFEEEKPMLAKCISLHLGSIHWITSGLLGEPYHRCRKGF